MATFTSDTLGAKDDTVTLVLGGKKLEISESYEIRMSALTTPGVFALRLGNDDVVAKLIKAYPPKTPFLLRVGGDIQMTGETDGFQVDQSSGGTTFNVRGRDALAPVHDAFILVEESLQSTTYVQLVQHILDRVGFKGSLFTSNDSNRNAQTGISVTASALATAGEELDPSGTGLAFRALQARVGERWFHFLKRELDRAGLFLWADARGNAILSRPNAKQSAIYRIRRKRGSERGKDDANVLSFVYKNETTHRFSECVAYGRYGGKKYGRAKAKGHFDDVEMQAFGYERPLVLHDINISNQKQAEFLSSRKLAESRREGWELSYRLAGHSTPAIGGGRATWAVDTCVEVIDDECGLQDVFWIGDVDFTRGPETMTTLRLMRREDLLFGETE